jgi:hypothetical protein
MKTASWWPIASKLLTIVDQASVDVGYGYTEELEPNETPTWVSDLVQFLQIEALERLVKKSQYAKRKKQRPAYSILSPAFHNLSNGRP